MTRVKVLMLTAVVLIAGAGIYSYQEFIGESQGTVTNPVADKTINPTPEPRITIQSQYASFSYPAKFTLIGSSPVVAPVVANYNFTKQQVGQWQIAIQISRIDSGSLSSDGSYNYRSSTPKQYSKTTRTIGNSPVTIFNDDSSTVFSKVGYIQHGSLDASISMTGGTPSTIAQLQTDFDALFASWQWR